MKRETTRARCARGSNSTQHRHPCRRQSGRLGSRAAELVGLLLLPAAGAELEGENRRLANAGQIDLPVCERNMPGKKTNLPEYGIICPGCFRPRTAVVARTRAGRRDHAGLSTTCPI